jgi:hypothetical protein
MVRGLGSEGTAQLIKLLLTPIGKVVWCRLSWTATPQRVPMWNWSQGQLPNRR